MPDSKADAPGYSVPIPGYTPPGQRARNKKPTLEKTSVVSKGTSNRIFATSSAASASSATEAIPREVNVTNEGDCPIVILSGYKSYSDETTIADSSATRYLHTMLMPGESFSPPVRSVISTENASTQFDGTISNSGKFSLTTDPVVFETDIGHEIFKVGDLIRVANEIMRVEGTYDDNPTSSTVADNHIVVSRAHNGSTAASHSGTPDINFAFFNAYHDYNSFATARTDGNGKFKTTNFFGLGRAISGNKGILPGSVAIKFYNPGYQELGLNGIGSSTESGLTAGATYYGSIGIDGASADKFTFTVDSSNTKFGGRNGVIAKIQNAIDALFYNPAKNNFEKGARVSVVNGDIRVTSLQRTSSSAIALTTNTDGTAGAFASGGNELWDGSNIIGRIPASPKGAVEAKIPELNTYDLVTDNKTPNSLFMVYDDGLGRLKNASGAANGFINYESGAFSLSNAPVNADFQYLVNYNSVFSGKANEASTGRMNSLIEILANTFGQKNGKVGLRTF